MEGKEIGKIAHYFSHMQVAVAKLNDELNKGDNILIKGHTTDFKQVVSSMQKDHNNIEQASKGDEVGLKVEDYVREGDVIFKI